MKRKTGIVALVIGCALPSAVSAASEPDVPDPQVLLQGIVSEEQVGLLFDYLRNALIAAAEGREGPVPEVLRRELDRIDADVKLRGTLAGLMLLKNLEAEVRELLRPPRDAAPRTPTYSPSTRT